MSAAPDAARRDLLRPARVPVFEMPASDEGPSEGGNFRRDDS